MDLDLILSELGEFSRFQIGVYFLLFFPLIFASMGSMTYVFTTGDLDYRCEIPQCETTNTSYDEPWLPFAVPYKDGYVEGHCKRYKSIDDTYHTNCSSKIFMSDIEECQNFVFKNNENNIIKEFNILCEKNNFKRTFVGTLHNVGEFIGMPIAGVISDRFGRKTMIVTAALCSAVFGNLKSFTRNYIQFVICEVADAIALGGIYAGIFVLGVEMTGPKKRSFGAVIISSYYSIGEMILGGLVWYVKDWRTYLRILYAPGFIFIIYYWILPESVRWLSTKGKWDMLNKTLKIVSSVNKKPMSEAVKKAMEQPEDNKSMETELLQSSDVPKNSMKEIFKSRIMLLRTLNCSFCWITNAFVYYGLSLNSVLIGGNKYFNFILISFIEIPGYIITQLVVGILGRKWSLMLALIISGSACIMFHFIPEGMQTARLITFLIGKCAITVSFTTQYVLASEFFPTNLRNSLMSFCSTIGRCGSMAAPQTPLLSTYVDPALIFGGISYTAACLALYFPETLHCKLPSTIQEAEVVGKGFGE